MIAPAPQRRVRGRRRRAAAALPTIVVRAIRVWRTLEPADWAALGVALAPVTAAFGGVAAVHLLHGTVLRLAREPEAAAAACRRALALRPGSAAALFALGRCLRQAGARAPAIAALRQAAEAGSAAAARELCRYGARAALPVAEPGVHARDHYAAFVAANPVPPPPAPAPAAAALPVLFAITGHNGALHPATRASLAAQTYPGWHLAGDRVPEGCAALPVYAIDLPPGATLDPQALGWLAHAAAATGSAVIRADHDHRDPATGARGDPVFLPQPDLLWTEGPGRIVRLEAVRRGPADAATAAASPATITHVPLVLMSLPAGAPPDPQPLPDAEPWRLSIVIPTRDNPAMLAVAVERLLATAARPDLLEFVIVDNGSRLPASHALFAQLERAGQTRIVAFDAPFNWSRANNLGAAAASGEALLFINDDTEMATPGWDRILAGLFARPEIGVSGVRMVYPDGTIQHAGLVFGMDNGPQHEGRWMAGSDPGPVARWTALRQAVAVTGAFMAMRTAEFEAIGGFDDVRYAVDFADIDLCMRLRRAGKAVAYCGAISLTHHESVSRGLNLGRAKRRRMRQERATLDRLWGTAAATDPGYHPVWLRTGCSYDGLAARDAAAVAQAIRAVPATAIWQIAPA